VDAETRQMLESIQAQISALGTDLRAEFRTELRAEIGGLRDELRAELRSEVGGLRAEMRAGDEMTRRHFDVVAESLRSDIRAVAEGVASSTELTLRLHHGLRAEMDGRFRSLEAVLRVTFADFRREIDDLRSDN
jgi:hypothetical protein